MPFPDMERVVAHLLADLTGGVDHVGTQTPADLAGRVPYVRVRRLGGADDGITDTAVVDVDSFAVDRSSSVALAEAIRDRLTTGPHHIDGVVVDGAETSTAPREIPWGGDNVRRWAATYRVTARRAAP